MLQSHLHVCCVLAGCRTGLSGFFTACVVGLVLLFLTPVFAILPLNVMGAIVISGVSGLFEYEQAIYLYKVTRQLYAHWNLFWW